MLRSLERILGSEHDITSTERGREALSLLQSRHFDTVLCDVMMPEMSGIELYQRVSARPDVRDAFVFMTGGAFSPRAMQFFTSKGISSLAKPLDFNVLRTLLNERTLRARA